jgi:hypothetical protein
MKKPKQKIPDKNLLGLDAYLTQSLAMRYRLTLTLNDGTVLPYEAYYQTQVLAYYSDIAYPVHVHKFELSMN